WGFAARVRVAVAARGFDDAVFAIDEHHAGAAGAGFCVCELLVGDDDQEVAGVDEVGGGAVNADFARAALAEDGVGLEAGGRRYVEGGGALAGRGGTSGAA